jgi:hypothetical protein
MAERPRSPARPIGMVLPPARGAFVALVLLVPLVLAGCGDDTVRSPGAPVSSKSNSDCAPSAVAPQPVANADLDADGTAETISYTAGSGACPATLSATVGGHEVATEIADPLPVTSADARAIAFPGRAGAVLAVAPQHPRGGFQLRLFGYADGKLAELTVDGQPIFPFVATDVTSTPLSATCTSAGFEVTEARPHQPIGVVPAWDLYRTTYSVAGNQVTRGATTELTGNVLPKQLRTKYGSLVDHSLFENCPPTS